MKALWRVGPPKADLPRADRNLKMFYVYVLKSKWNGDYYKGSTTDLKQRVKEHLAGQVNTTKINGPWELIYYEAFASKTDARREELFLKSGKGRERIKNLFTDTEGGQDGNALVLKTSSRKG